MQLLRLGVQPGHRNAVDQPYDIVIRSYKPLPAPPVDVRHRVAAIDTPLTR
jgi:hypothetical protein